MTSVTETVFKQALTLGPVDRAELIEALFRSFDERGSAENDALWAAEAESRLDAYKAGKLKADSAMHCFDRITG